MTSPKNPPSAVKEPVWNSIIPHARWNGFRRHSEGIKAFASLEAFETAQLSELEFGLEEHEKKTLGRLLARGKKPEIEVFTRTHGPNPVIDPKKEWDAPVGVAKADRVDLTQSASPEANQAILNGDVVHVLFQAGEASRFERGPFLSLNPVEVARSLSDELGFSSLLEKVGQAGGKLPEKLAAAIINSPLGPDQPFMIRAALRRVIADEIKSGRLPLEKASEAYAAAIKNQKVLFIISRRGGVAEIHDKALRETYKFYGFTPQNVVTIEQQLVRGITADEEGKLSLLKDDETSDAAGHLYALMQAARPEDFTSYTETGRPIKSAEVDGLSYIASRGGKILNIVRINDMDRHSTEIINPKAVTYALNMFKKGYVNVIEGVSNPHGQKGGTGTTFGDTEAHVLTETHENSFPSLSRAFDVAMKKYLEENAGAHPAYNAMRQLADLAKTRAVLREFGGRIVFVPRQKEINGKTVNYLGVDMPMGDLSLLLGHYKSRMFQFVDGSGRELLIHDMKKRENLDFALKTTLRKLEDPHVVAAAKELFLGEKVPFDDKTLAPHLYGAPAPEFE